MSDWIGRCGRYDYFHAIDFWFNEIDPSEAGANALFSVNWGEHFF